MNKIIKASVILFAAALSIVNTSCDKFDTFPLNIPFSVTIAMQGVSPTIQTTSQYCLTQSKTYQDYVEDIEKLTFIEAAWRTESSSFNNGTVELTVKIVGGATLFQKTLAGTNPLDYKSPNGPFVLTFTDSEIQALNNYLSAYLQNPNQCLEVTAKATANAGTPPYSLSGIFDIVVEGETKF